MIAKLPEKKIFPGSLYFEIFFYMQYTYKS